MTTCQELLMLSFEEEDSRRAYDPKETNSSLSGLLILLRLPLHLSLCCCNAAQIPQSGTSPIPLGLRQRLELQDMPASRFLFSNSECDDICQKLQSVAKRRNSLQLCAIIVQRCMQCMEHKANI